MPNPLDPIALADIQERVDAGDDMAGLARALADAKARAPREAKKLFAACGLTLAKGYALIAIGRALPSLGADRARLNRIGWAKLHAILPKLGAMPVEDLLDLAERVSARRLPAVLKGRAPPAGTRRMAFDLAPDDLAKLIAALVACGAHQTRRGLRRRETALMRLLDLAGCLIPADPEGD